jgi:hypothetical protein
MHLEGCFASVNTRWHTVPAATRYLGVGLKDSSECWDGGATYFRAKIHRTDGIVVLAELRRRGEKRTSDWDVELIR